MQMPAGFSGQLLLPAACLPPICLTNPLTWISVCSNLSSSRSTSVTPRSTNEQRKRTRALCYYLHGALRGYHRLADCNDFDLCLVRNRQPQLRPPYHQSSHHVYATSTATPGRTFPATGDSIEPEWSVWAHDEQTYRRDQCDQFARLSGDECSGWRK